MKSSDFGTVALPFMERARGSGGEVCASFDAWPPTGLEEVIAEDSSTSAYATLASHPLRSNYCGASRVKPVLGSTSGTSFVAAGVMPVLITGTSP
jgi:hypothetical protein